MKLKTKHSDRTFPKINSTCGNWILSFLQKRRAAVYENAVKIPAFWIFLLRQMVKRHLVQCASNNCRIVRISGGVNFRKSLKKKSSINKDCCWHKKVPPGSA